MGRLKACTSCRTRKIRCNGKQPQCRACEAQQRECEYQNDAPRERPTYSRIHELQHDKATLENFIRRLSLCKHHERASMLEAAVDQQGQIQLQGLLGPGTEEQTSHAAHTPPSSLAESLQERQSKIQTAASPSSISPLPTLRLDKKLSPARDIDEISGDCDDDDDEKPDIRSFISVDEVGRPCSFGPSSALYRPASPKFPVASSSRKTASSDKNVLRNALISQAALQRQLEYRLSDQAVLDGTPIGIVNHLLDLHWARQHHTFLLTYRPAIMRDLIRQLGPHYSIFLLNAILACSAKYSNLIILREDPGRADTAGAHFFRRCDDLLMHESLLVQPSIPTIVGLLLLGSTYNSLGKTSKGWLYTGYALRMVYDMSLHLDPQGTTAVAEDIEVRRRVFWGAFICDKLQSLYLGRPTAIKAGDCRVSIELLDTFDEHDIFQPGGSPAVHPCFVPHTAEAVPIRSISTFQQLCRLSKIMDVIINRFYVVSAPLSNARHALEVIDDSLARWKWDLSPENDFNTEVQPPDSASAPCPPPNVMVLHSLYYCLIVLLHRPFISDGHLRRLVTDAPVRACWERCTIAARSITTIQQAYGRAFGLSAAPYILGYAAYVSCTIHVRNAAAQTNGNRGENHMAYLAASLGALEAICAANPGLTKPVAIIRRLMTVRNVHLSEEENLTISYDALSPGINWTAILDTFPHEKESGDAERPYSADSPLEEPGADIVSDPLFGLLDGDEMSWGVDMENLSATGF